MIRNLNADLTELLDIPELIADDYEIQRGIVFIHAHPKDDSHICEKCGNRKTKVIERLKELEDVVEGKSGRDGLPKLKEDVEKIKRSLGIWH